MMKIVKSLALFAALAAFGSQCQAQIPYKVTVPVPDVQEGTMAYMLNYDTGEKVDSTIVKAQKAYFTGDVDDPFVVTVMANGKRYGTLILEQGASAVNQEKQLGVGTMLNDQLVGYLDALDDIAAKFQASSSQEEAEKYYNQYLDSERKALLDNLDSPIGYFLFVDYATAAEPADLVKITTDNPDLMEYQRVQRLMDAVNKALATAPGQQFADFEVTYNGKTQRLSDYVGKGQYVLVDFWASWCGPCRREMKTIKEINSAYADKGLKVLGVAVWDKPDDTEAAIKQLGLPWEVIINAQTIPTDIYGISGIPHVILFSPDGKILSRGLQGEELKAEVAKYF